jgi:hypothetical protein
MLLNENWIYTRVYIRGRKNYVQKNYYVRFLEIREAVRNAHGKPFVPSRDLAMRRAHRNKRPRPKRAIRQTATMKKAVKVYCSYPSADNAVKCNTINTLSTSCTHVETSSFQLLTLCLCLADVTVAYGVKSCFGSQLVDLELMPIAPLMQTFVAYIACVRARLGLSGKVTEWECQSGLFIHVYWSRFVGKENVRWSCFQLIH